MFLHQTPRRFSAKHWALAAALIILVLHWNLSRVGPLDAVRHESAVPQPSTVSSKPDLSSKLQASEPSIAIPEPLVVPLPPQEPQDVALSAASEAPAPSKPPAPSEPPCTHIAGGEDVFVVLKSGATEIHQKLPIHFSTTFRCIPHYAIYSDLEEKIDGRQIHDTLDEIPEDTIQAIPDFELYQRMQAYRTQGKNGADLIAEAEEGLESEVPLSQQAWNLDKWKFLPLMEKALKARTGAKWFVFIEADTYLVWSNLLRWLTTFDSGKPYYLGGQAMMGDTEFAHGGTGFIVSTPALRMVVEEWKKNQKEWIEKTKQFSAGDALLAEAFKAVGVNLYRSWPALQGETPDSLDYTAKHWCWPVVSYHHMKSEWITKMWEFEQSWIGRGSESPPMRHHDVFDNFGQPRIQVEQHDWDNLSGNPEESINVPSVGACREYCSAKHDCLQYSYRTGQCRIDRVIRFGWSTAGKEAEDVISGWMVDRINAFKQGLEPCKQEWQWDQ